MNIFKRFFNRNRTTDHIGIGTTDHIGIGTTDPGIRTGYSGISGYYSGSGISGYNSSGYRDGSVVKTTPVSLAKEINEKTTHASSAKEINEKFKFNKYKIISKK